MSCYLRTKLDPPTQGVCRRFLREESFARTGTVQSADPISSILRETLPMSYSGDGQKG